MGEYLLENGLIHLIEGRQRPDTQPARIFVVEKDHFSIHGLGALSWTFR